MFAFDRLIAAADRLASRRHTELFVAQIGQGQYAPRFMQSIPMMTSRVYAETVRTSKLVVAHAGIGSVISALEAGKPIVVLPRKSALREVTTDHQIATAKWLQQKSGVFVACDESELEGMVDQALAAGNESRPGQVPTASELICKVRSFIGAGRP